MDNFRNETSVKLNKIPDKGQILFGVLICERLYPNYGAFQKAFNWGNSTTLQEGIALLRQYIIKGDLFDDHDVKDIIERIDWVTPNTEDFSSIIVSFALDACTSVQSMLNYLLDKNVENIVDVACFSRDTVDMYVQEIEGLKNYDPNLEEKIRSSEYMIREMEFQKGLLNKIVITDLSRITDEIVNNLSGGGVGINLSLLR